ncbi:spermidine synthase [Sinisalibacter lacisalsi]|uniref:Spermidine synthase n=1 Tax=Sinisalibacter lacisalsi TaxID=1526570 RepID=A0ABQ1QRA5_9RHOB|nr:spermidine synthase [Sinisalibacter lacisalsi]GGD42192.1 spermidine synthase [Sinisalibacter lacisalsi]
MSALFEELDYCPTPIGALSLRRRRDLRLGVDVWEILLGQDFLMTSHFTASEVALGRSGVAACAGDRLDVVVGGLGLGYTAEAVLDEASVSTLLVVEFLAPVIEWHETGILPMKTRLADDPRCRLVEGDFFAMASGEGFDPDQPGRRFEAILADIDHAPDHLLDDRSDSFYRVDGLRALKRHLKPGGVFGLWSDAVTDPQFLDRLGEAFGQAWAEPVTFDNPLTGQPFTQTVYLARAEAE